jgi:hypothetical protein
LLTYYSKGLTDACRLLCELMTTLLAGIAEFERSLIEARTRHQAAARGWRQVRSAIQADAASAGAQAA